MTSPHFLRSAVLLACALFTPSLIAQTSLYWGATGSDPVGGTGTWNTTDARWSSAESGGTYAAWDNGNNDIATFAGTAGTVTLGTDITAGGLTFSTTGYTLTGAQTLTLANSIVTLDTGTGDQVISSNISSGSSLNKIGSGSLTLSGTNTLSGITTISAGTLRGTTSSLPGHIENNAALIFDQDTDGTFSSVIFGTGTLEKAGSGTVTLGQAGSFTGSTTISEGSIKLANESALSFSTLATTATGTLSFGTLTTANLGGISSSGDLALTNDSSAAVSLILGFNNADTTYSGILSGSGSLNKFGTGTLTLSGANTYTGGTTVSMGTLKLDSSGALGSSGDIAFLVGVLQHTANNTTDYSSRFSSTAGQLYQIDTNGQSVTYASPITSVGGYLLKSGEGTLTLSANNTFTGGVSVTGGTLALGHATDTLADTGSVGITNATLDLGSNSDTIGSLSVSSGNITGSGTLTTSLVSLENAGSISTILAGSGNLIKNGTGTFTLTAANTYTGFTVLSGGTLRLDFVDLETPTNVLSNATTFVFAGGTLEVLGKSTGSTSQTLDLTYINSGDNAIVVDSNGGTSSILALTSFLRFVGGIVDFTLPANGSITTSDANTNGLLGGYATVGKSDWATVSSGAIVASSYTDDTWASGNNTNITTSGTPASDATTNSLRFATAGAQTLTLAGTNTIESGGILVTSAVGDNASTITGGTLRGTASADLIVINHNPDNSLTIASVIADNTFATGLTKSGTGALILSGSNTYSGVTQINNGTLQLGADNVIADNSAISLTTDGILDLNDHTDAVGSLTGTGNITLGSGALTAGADNTSTEFSGVISGTGTLTKSGTGTLTLSGANTHTGTTTVSAGSLILSGSASTSDFTLNGGTLTGTGTLGGLTISSGGTVSPGDSPGILNAGNTIFESNGNFAWEINNATGDAEFNWDLLNITGDLTINATSGSPFIVSITSLTEGNVAGLTPNFDSSADYSYTIATASGGITGFSADAFSLNTDSFTNSFSGTWSIGVDGNNLNLSYSAVPEPSTYAALFGLIALAATAIKRRRLARA